MNGYYLYDKCTQYVEERADNKVRVTLFYGKYREYSICKTNVDNNSKAIKDAFKAIRDKKKYITPLHGCCIYI